MSSFFDSETRALRMLIASVTIVVAPILATGIEGVVERTAIIIAAGLIALAIGLDQKTPTIRNRQAKAPLLDDARETTIKADEEWQKLIEGISSPILIVSDMTVIQCNQAALDMLGDTIVGEDVRLVIRHPTATDIISRHNEQQLKRPVELVGIGASDHRWELNVTSLSKDDCIVYLWDQTRTYAIEKMRTDFVANVSHELRTPLSSIIGFIETLGEKGVGTDAKTRKRFLKVMSGEATRMQQLISDLISLSRIEADKYKPPETILSLDMLIKDVESIFVERGHSALHVDLPEMPMAVRGDYSQLSQMLQNLVTNAIKYGHEDTPVTIKLRPSRGRNMARVTITDQGDGIDPKHLPRLTERFYRIDSGRSRAIGGTGLGLSIVKHIVHRHGGQLEIDSVVGTGTKITISLPTTNTGMDEADTDTVPQADMVITQTAPEA